MPNLDALRYLIELSKANSINVASGNLYVSKSAISSAIKKLEDELQTELITRTYRGVTLTETGKEVVALAEEIMSLMNKIKHIGEKIAPTNSLPIIHIYAGEFNLLSSILALVNSFSEIFGKNNFEIHSVKEQSEIIKKIAENPYHIGFYLENTLTPSIPNEQEYVSYTAVTTSYMNLIACKNSKYIQNQEIVSLKDILNLPLISLKDSNFIFSLPSFIGEPNLIPNLAFSVPTQASYWQALQEDLGVGFQLKSVNHFHFFNNPNLATYPIREKIAFTIYLLYHKDFPEYTLMQLLNQFN